MAITIPDRTQIRLVTDFDEPNNGHALPACIVSVAMVNPGPVAIDTTAASNGQAQVKPAYGDSGRASYVGYNIEPNKGVGSPVSPVRAVLIDGFAGVVAGSPVYLDNTSADASGSASGLTHTQPATGNAQTLDDEVNAGTLSATGTILIEVPDGATTLTELDFTVATTVPTDAANIWTPTLVNLGNASAAMLAAAPANTNNSTGGAAYTANVPTVAALTGTAANLVVSGGQVLSLTFTKSASAPNLVNLVIRASFAGSVGSNAQRFGLGWTTTKILVL